MYRMTMRKLPFSLTSHFTAETVRQIKAIPDEEIKYTEEEIIWMAKAVRNLDYMIAQAECFEGDTEVIVARRTQFEVALTVHKG